RVTSTALPSSDASPSAHATGVAGSPVEPTTTIGGEPGACKGPGRITGGVGHTRHEMPPHPTGGPKYGACLAAAAANAAKPATVVGWGWSRQLIAVLASTELS